MTHVGIYDTYGYLDGERESGGIWTMYVLDSMNVSVLFVKEKMWVLWGRVCV